MENKEQEMLLRKYAAGEITWSTLRERGFDNYVSVLGGLGELGLRPSVAPLEGPNVAARTWRAAIAEDFDLEAILFFEDTDIKKRRFVRGLPENVTALSTGDLLYELEAAGR